MPNGAIYLVETEWFLETGSLFCEEGTIAYEMSLEKSVDIDMMDDVVRVEKVMSEISNLTTVYK